MKKLLGFLLVVTALSCDKNDVSDPCEEKPSDGRMCTYEYNPVCGCNGKTYGNSCAALAVGITQFTAGACGQSKQ